jgi:outer membrane protein assembly factor BamB
MKSKIVVAVVTALLICGAGASAATDDWTTQDHDQQRTGFQPQHTGINRDNVGSLKLHWAVPLNELAYASPLVAGGRVYVATGKGNVYALRVSDGSIIWKTRVGDYIRMTPALADGLLFVGNYGIETGPRNHVEPSTGSMSAISAKTGKLVWKTPVRGLVRSEPVIAHGIVFEGIAGGDTWNGCLTGGIVSFDEFTGQLLARRWNTSSRLNNGGGVWSPLSFDGSTLYFGTGNTCDGTGMQESVVALALDMTTRWATVAHKLLSPEKTKLTESLGGQDVGSGVMIRGNRVYAKAKSGILYSLDKATGKKIWQNDFRHGDAVGSGGFGTPTGDGSMIMGNSGEGSMTGRNDGLTTLVAVDYSGRQKYVFQEQTSVTPSLTAAFIDGIGFAPLDSSIIAFDSHTGTKLWSYKTQDDFYGSPVIVPSGLYTVDVSGNVYAFALRGASQAVTPSATLRHLFNPDKQQNPISKKLLVGAALGIGFIAWISIMLLRRLTSARLPKATMDANPQQ